ncbi:MAG: AzlC family ABC transporter permease [Veillonellales bacterium]
MKKEQYRYQLNKNSEVLAMGAKTRALKAAFPYTIPVLTGYIFLGAAYGILMNSKGYSLGLTVLMSIITYAGSMQFVAVNLLAAAFNPLYAFLLTLMINARHLFYGISMLNRFSGTGKKKIYLVFGLTDETFSLLCSTEPPQGIDRNWFMFFVTLLDHLYWITGSILGGVVGAMVSFNTKGIDFVMTALFVVILTNQWKSQKHHSPAIIGLGVTAACLFFFGSIHFMIPSMVMIIVILTLFKAPIERKAAE